MADNIIVQTEEKQVAEARDAAAKAQANRTDAEKKAIQAQAEINNTRDPVEEEKRNNERMFARERLDRSGLNVDVENEVNSKLIADAGKKLAEAKSAYESVLAAADRHVKRAEAHEKAKAEEAKVAKAKLDEAKK